MTPSRALLAAIVPILMAPTTCSRSHPPPCPDADHDGVQAFECGGTDCDDSDPERFPGQSEVCDSMRRDEDCDPSTFGDRDADGDGFADSACCNGDVGDAGIPLRCGGDCNDNAAGTHPDQNESCNQIDDDCDGAVDETVLMNVYLDYDEDGHGTGAASQACALTPGFSYLANDCNDKSAAILPGAMQCSGASYVVCGSDGVFSAPASCGGQATCHTQPNTTGVCY